MGLDMYLKRMPRYRGATANDISAVEDYLDWMRAKENGSKYADCSFEDWCGRKRIPPMEYVEFYKLCYKKHYSEYDIEHQHPWWYIKEEVGYWRKANQIHNWFVENIQDGIDDCKYHREVTEEDLRELLYTCATVLNSCELVEGQICNGYRYENGEKVPIVANGKYVKDPTIAKELLPSTSGFFFGGTDYDEYYVEDIKNTIEIINRVLETTNFDTHMIYYGSSW